jgi:hypothetical protein
MRNEGLGRAIIALAGVVSMGIGIYFIFFRPPLLPEDLAFIGANQNIDSFIPQLGNWLKNVFTVMGGFIISTGFLKLAIGRILPSRSLAAVWLVSWFFSSALMSFINFKINSDFKWELFSLALFELLGIGAICISVIKSKIRS